MIMYIIIGGAYQTLEDFLWEEHRILIIYLPARTPEWNPMELVWGILVRRLGLYNLSAIRQHNTNAIAHAASAILKNVTHEDVWKFYKKILV